MAEYVTDTDGTHGLKIESGTWTPTIEGSVIAGSNVYNSVVTSGRYIKQNKIVTCWFRLVMSTKDSNMEGRARIGALPYVIRDTNALRAILSIGYSGLITSPPEYSQITGEGVPGINSIELRALKSGLATYRIMAPDIANNAEINGQIIYETN